MKLIFHSDISLIWIVWKRGLYYSIIYMYDLILTFLLLLNYQKCNSGVFGQMSSEFFLMSTDRKWNRFTDVIRQHRHIQLVKIPQLNRKLLTKHMVSNSAVSHEKQRWRPFNAIYPYTKTHSFIHSLKLWREYSIWFQCKRLRNTHI